MAEELRPMHEVVLEDLESDLGTGYLSYDAKVRATVKVWRIFQKSKVPEKHLGEVIERLKKQLEAAEEGSTLQERLQWFIRDLEARQPIEQPAVEAVLVPEPAEAAETDDPGGVVGGLAPTAPPEEP